MPQQGSLGEPMGLLGDRTEDGGSDMTRMPQVNASVEFPQMSSNDSLGRAAKSAVVWRCAAHRNRGGEHVHDDGR
jgi:hypothetical protein